MTSLFFAEHHITDKEGWDQFQKKWMDIMGADDMNIDKALQYPEFEGNACILACNDTSGTFTICLWQVPIHMTKKEFQEFMDRFTCGYATNTVYAVEGTIGAQNLDPREFVRNWMRVAKGKPCIGFADRDQLWMLHHNIIDREGWETKVCQGMADAVKKCNTPSEASKLTPESIGTALVLILDDNTSICIDGTKSMTKEEYQAAADKFAQGTAQNTAYLVDMEKSAGFGINMLSEDVFNQDFLKWGEDYVNPFAKTASHEHVPETSYVHLTSQ